MRTYIAGLVLVAALSGHAVARADDDWKGVPMKGPFITLKAFCQTITTDCPRAKHADDIDWLPWCNTTADGKSQAVSGPYKEVRTFTSSCVQQDGRGPYGVIYHLGVRLVDGWYIASHIFKTQSANPRYCNDVLATESLVVRDFIPGGAPEIVLRGRSYDQCPTNGKSKTEEDTREYLVVAGMGATGKPSATPAMLVGFRYRLSDAESSKTLRTSELHLQIQFLSDGRISVVGPAAWPPPARDLQPPPLGTHRLVFP